MAWSKQEFTAHTTVIGSDFLNDLQDDIIDEFSKSVKVDAAQTFSTTQKAQGRANIGAVSSDDVNTAVTAAKILVVSGTISSSSNTISNSAITANMVCINSEIGTPSAQTADWTVTTSAGAVAITPASAIGASTTIKLYLAVPQ